MYQKISSTVLFQHPRLTLEEDDILLPSGKRSKYLRFENIRDSVIIVCRNDRDEVLFLNEYSYIPNKFLVQFPMGRVEQGETPFVAANRELQEEAGLLADTLELAGTYLRHHRRSADIAHVFLGSDLRVSHRPADMEEEGITLKWIPSRQIDEKVRNGEIQDSASLAALRLCGL